MAIEIPSIDAKYLVGLPDSVLLAIKNLTQGCPKNTIRNTETNNCVMITGLVAKKIIKALSTSKLNIVKKSCAIPTYPIAKKPVKKASPIPGVKSPLTAKNLLVNGVKCSAKSKFVTDVNYICNPLTGSWIKKGGPTFNKLLKEYSLQDLENFKQLIASGQ